MEIIAIVISLFTTVFSGVLVLCLQRFMKKKDTSQLQKDELIKEETVLILRSIDVLSRICLLLAQEIESNNAVLDNAIKEATATKEEFNHFLISKNVLNK